MRTSDNDGQSSRVFIRWDSSEKQRVQQASCMCSHGAARRALTGHRPVATKNDEIRMSNVEGNPNELMSKHCTYRVEFSFVIRLPRRSAAKAGASSLDSHLQS